MTTGAMGDSTRSRAPWWRERWVGLALIVLAGQTLAIWMLSADGIPRASRPMSKAPRFNLATAGESAGEAGLTAWGHLRNPAVMLLPYGDDFSTAAWTGGRREGVELEAFVARSQPLEFQAIRGGAAGLEPLPRTDPGLAGSWGTPKVSGTVAWVPGVTLPAEGRVWIVEGLRGWRLVSPPRMIPREDGGLPQRAVVRVVIDRTGGLASPPVLWESSGDPGADEVALRQARQLEMERSELKAGPEDGWRFGELFWGHVAFSWPAPTSAGEETAEGKR